MYNLAIRMCTSPPHNTPEVEIFQIKIYYPAGDRIPDPLNLLQTCYHLSQRGELVIYATRKYECNRNAKVKANVQLNT